jgi:hypothetical protein
MNRRVGTKVASLGWLAGCAMALAACGHGPPVASYAPTSDGWTHLCEPKRFVVDFPATPQEGRRELEGANGPLVATTWDAAVGARAYLVEYMEFDDVTSPPEAIIGDMRDHAIGHGRVIDDRPRTGEGWAADDLIVELHPANKQPEVIVMQIRVVLSRQQAFILITAAPTIETDQAAATRFLTSLRYRDAALDCE